MSMWKNNDHWEGNHPYFNRVADFYDHLAITTLDWQAPEFVEKINSRLSQEIIYGERKGRFSSPAFEGNAFIKFIDDETQYLLTRMGLNAARNVQQYVEVRDLVIEGFTKRAIDFFKETKGNTHRKNDGVTLRCNLERWIGQ